MINIFPAVAPPTLLPLPHTEVMTPQIGSSVTLSCEARGVPEPDVTWYRNGRKLNSGRTLQLVGQKLMLNSVQVSLLTND